MKRAFIIFITVLGLLSTSFLYAQMDTKGTDFWITFGTNGNTYTSSQVSLQVRVVADVATTGTIEYTELGTSVPITISAGGVYTHSLTTAEKAAVYSTSNGTNDKTVRIRTDNPVTVYAMNQTQLFTDATNILPVQVLGTDYYQIQYGARANSGYMVIAIENNTKVFHNGTLLATLNAGQVYRYYSSSELTGAHVTSDKPVAYFSTQVNSIDPSSLDYLFQQFGSINTWGKDFLVPVTLRGVERIRILASKDGTTITQTGGTIQSVTGGQATLNLNAGQWVELEISLVNNGCYIHANNPIAVCSFLLGNSYPGVTMAYGQGDPSMAWIPSIEQTLKQGLIAPFVPNDATVINRHYAIIITPTATKNSTTVKIGTGTEQALSGGVWNDNLDAGISFYNVALTNATSSYVFTNPAGLSIMGYGLATGTETYYYMATSSMRSLDVAFYVNDIHNQDLPAEVFTTGALEFRAEIEYAMSLNPGHLKWYIDGVEETAARDQLTWNKTLPNGIYQLKMEVLLSDNVTTKIVESTLTIGIPFDLEVCSGTGVTFTATINNGGTTPLYQWLKNGLVISGATASTYSYVPSDGDVITCELTSNANCADPVTVVSHSVTIAVHALPVPVLHPLSDVCEGAPLTFSVPAVYSAYEWRIGSSSGATVSDLPYLTQMNVGTYTYVLRVQDEHGCWSAYTPAATGVITAAPASAPASLDLLDTDYTSTPPEVTFNIYWNADSRNCRHEEDVWVFIDYQPVADNAATATWSRALVNTLPSVSSGTAELASGNNRGFWLHGIDGAYSSTVTVPVTVSGTMFNWCAYVADYPPNAVAQGGNYELHGAAPFVVNGVTLGVSATTYTGCITSLTDATGSPGILPGVPVIDAATASSPTIHSGDSTLLRISARNAVQYSFDNGTTWENNGLKSVSPTTSTTYTIAAKSAGGCVVTGTIAVTVQ